MRISHTNTIDFEYTHRSDGWHMLHEIDDEDMGYWSVLEYIIPVESVTKLLSVISEDAFIDICRKDGLSGMCDFLDSRGIPYHRAEDLRA